jgi:diguanylate cyclase (GGDEF)-like protein
MHGSTAARIRTRLRSRSVARTALLFACVLLRLLGCSTAQAADRFEVSLFDQSNGLGNLSITAIAQQRDGHLWVGTENGLFRYDGSEFVEFNRASGLNDPVVFSLLIDSTGTLWAGTHHGLFWLDGKVFHELRRDPGKSLRIGLNSMLASNSSGELVVETAQALLSVERLAAGGTWSLETYEQRHPAYQACDDGDGVAFDAQGSLWLGCTPGIERFDRYHLRSYGSEQGVPKDYYVSMYRARDGSIWARGRKHILTLRPGETRFQDVSRTLPAGAIDIASRRFSEDAAGNILTPTSQGFATWNGSRWQEAVSTNAGPIDGASDVFCDHEGSVWIGTQGLGLLQSRGYGQWQNYGKSEGMRNPLVDAIAADRSGRVWIGNSVGASYLSPGAGTIKAAALLNELEPGSISGLAATPGGGIWAATESGVVVHVDASGRVDVQTSIDGYAQWIVRDARGTLWIAMSTGLYSLEQQRGAKAVAVAGLAGAQVSGLLPDADRLWVASDRGLDRVDTMTRSVTHIQMDRPEHALTDVAQAPDGTFWVAGGEPGVAHLRIVGARAYPLGTLTRPRLASDLVEFLGFDHVGRLWIGSDRGVNILDGTRLKSLTTADGLIWNVCSSHAFLAQPDGSIWIGTALGVSHLLHPDVLLRRGSVAASIESMEYDNRQLGNGEQLRWGHGALLVHFTALTMRDNQSMVYHYKLGSEEAVTTTAPIARFEGLDPGSYTLKLIAEDRGQAVFSTPVSVRFTLTPPWWRSSLFIAAVLLVFMGSAALALRWWHLVLLQRQKRLEKLVDERTSEIHKMALTDSLTGLPNRRAIVERVEREFQRARLQGLGLCLAIVDLDHFKRINDTFGHQAGDDVLREAAARLSSAIRMVDAVGRYGGEEFLVVFESMPRQIQHERCELLRQALCAEPVGLKESFLTVTCSIGVACSRPQHDSITELLARADEALYVAKKNGRNRVELETQPHSDAESLLC